MKIAANEATGLYVTVRCPIICAFCGITQNDTQNDENRNFTEKFISMASVFHQKLIKDSNSAHIFKLDCLFRYFLIFPHSEIPSNTLLFVFFIFEISSFLDFLSAIMMPLQRAAEIQTNDEPLQIKLYDSRCEIFLVFFLYFSKV